MTATDDTDNIIHSPTIQPIHITPVLQRKYSISKNGHNNSHIDIDSNNVDSNEYTINNDNTKLLALNVTDEHNNRDNIVQTAKLTTATTTSSYAGIIYVALSALMFSLMSLFVSLTSLQQNISSFEILTIRCIIQALFSLISCIYLRLNPFGIKQTRIWLILRGIVGIVSMSCLYYSITVIGISDATVLFFVAPVYAGIAGRILLHEEWTIFDNMCAIGSIIGCIFVARPSFIFHTSDNIHHNTNRLYGICIALSGAFLTAMVYILIRKIGKTTHTQVLTFITGFAGLIWGPMGLILWQTYTSPLQWSTTTTIYMISVGLCAFIAQTLFNKGVQLESAGIASMTRNLDVVFVFIWQSTVLRQDINILSVIGAIIMSISVLAIGIKKLVKNQRAEKLENSNNNN